MTAAERAKVTIKCEYVYDSVTQAFSAVTTYNKVYIRTEEVKQMDLGVTIAAKSGPKKGSLGMTYSNLHRKENEEETVTFTHERKENTYNEGHYQLYRTVVTSFTGMPSYDGRKDGRKVEKVLVATRSEEPTDDEREAKAKQWMQENYGTDGTQKMVTIDLEPPPFVEWVTINRGDALPGDEFAVKAGTTDSDGAVYVGRLENAPGKINLYADEKPNKMWNFWAHGEGSSQVAEVLVTNMEQTWVPFKKHDPKHSKGLVGDDLGDTQMRTRSDGLVVVAKNYKGEPGKLNFFDEKKYCHLWTHGDGKSTSGYVLVLKE